YHTHHWGVIRMSLNKNIKVPLPERGIIKYKNKGVTYAYYITRIYRNEKGQPTNDRVSIGKIDEETGMLIPNRNYYEIYAPDNAQDNQATQPKIESIKSCGVTYTVDGLLNELGLIDIMKRKFPKHADQIIALAEYMLCEGNVMSYYEDWHDEVYPHGNVRLSSADISRVFQSIDYKSRMDFFKTWIYARNQSEYIAYDVTSVSSYSKGIEALEWGYNRDKESLPQLNVAMYYGQQSMLPLYYCVYPGSIPDKTHLEYMLRDNELIGFKGTKYVMDRGFFTADNLRFMTEAGARFIISVPNSSLFARELIDKYRCEIVNRSECRLGKNLPYAKAVIRDDFGMRVKAHIYYNPAKAAAEEEILFDEIERCECALGEMTEPPARILQYDRYFKINRTKEGGLGFIRDTGKINAVISRLGFFIIVETDFEVSSLDVLMTYRQRDVVEKSFDDLKNELDMKRLHCHSDQTAEGKMFVAFFALILRSCMQNKLRTYMAETGTTFSSVLKELRKIKYVHIREGKKLLSPITKKQRDILDALGLSTEDFTVWLDSLSV
ncbi:MAG: transposase, partial [Clostridia bacterium]|nr:transposase [Clostridia bacterium]